MSKFNWDAVPVTVTNETTTTSAGAGDTGINYTVPAGKRWLLLSWRGQLSETRAGYFYIYKTGTTTPAESMTCNGTDSMAGSSNYGSRSFNGSTSYSRSTEPIYMQAGDILRIGFNASAGAKTVKTVISYKEANA